MPSRDMIVESSDLPQRPAEYQKRDAFMELILASLKEYIFFGIFMVCAKTQ